MRAVATTAVRPLRSMNLFWHGSECLREADPATKCRLTEELVQALRNDGVSLDGQPCPEPPLEPGRPSRPPSS